jgi:hypothetical protein
MNVAGGHQTHVTWLQRPVDGIMILVAVTREDNLIAHTNAMVHLPSGKIGVNVKMKDKYSTTKSSNDLARSHFRHLLSRLENGLSQARCVEVS